MGFVAPMLAGMGGATGIAGSMLGGLLKPGGQQQNGMQQPQQIPQMQAPQVPQAPQQPMGSGGVQPHPFEQLLNNMTRSAIQGILKPRPTVNTQQTLGPQSSSGYE